jgi:hypothetical protein
MRLGFSKFGLFSFAVLCFFAIAFSVSASAEDLELDGTGSPPTTTINSLPHYYPISSPSGNKVTVSADLPASVSGGVVLPVTNATVSTDNNTLRIFGDNRLTTRYVNGGYIFYNGLSDLNIIGSASNNDILIKNTEAHLGGGVFADAVGGRIDIVGYGDFKTNNNTLVVQDNSQFMYIWGGTINVSNTSTYTSTVEILNNTIIISDSSTDKSIGGGQINVTYLDKGYINKNKITVIGNTSIGGSLYGGFAAPPTNTPTELDVFTGNVLNVVKPKSGGITVANNVFNFQEYNFTFDLNNKNNNIGLNVANTATLNDGASRPSEIKSINFEGDSLPEPGDEFILIQAGNINDNSFNQTSVSGARGVNFLYDYDLVLKKDATLPDTLSAVVNDLTVHPQMESLSQSQSAGLEFLNQGLDLVTNQGINAVLSRPFVGQCPSSFFTVGAGKSRYGSGNTYDLDSYFGLVGLDCTGFFESGTLKLGGFFEVGKGSYKSHAIYPGQLAITGKGDLSYVGLGVLGRFDFDTPSISKTYLDGSLRLGQLRSDYLSSDFQNSKGDISFKSESVYVGGHFGVGRPITINADSSLDIYGKYMFTYLSGDSIVIDQDTPVTFDASMSHRLRGGIRFTRNVGVLTKLHAGAGYDYELDGKTKATTMGYPIKTVDMKGGTAFGELGLSFNRGGDSPISFGVGVEGYVGKRDGISGTLQLLIDF